MVRIQSFSEIKSFFYNEATFNVFLNTSKLKSFHIKRVDNFFLNKFNGFDKVVFFADFKTKVFNHNSSSSITFFYKNLKISFLLFLPLKECSFVISSFFKKLLLRFELFNLWVLVLFKVFAASLIFFKNSIFCLDLIFMRRRFFPQIIDNSSGVTIVNSSLGLMSKFFSKRKTFLRSKSSYIILSVFLRRVLVNIRMSKIRLKIRGLPLHLKSILNCLLSQANSFYQNPFRFGYMVNEKESSNIFFFTFLSIHFYQNKFYGFKKSKKCGRLKRKIRKKVIINNNIID